MAIVCSNCEVAPAAEARPGGNCAACGERLISVETGDDLIGVTIDDRFEILAPLGKGGMGVVYRAKQLSIGREVALKVIDRRIEKDVGAVKRFFREAKVAATLQHPNVVPVIEFGQHAGGRLFLAMELIKGRTLTEEINATGAMPLPRVAAIGTQLCDALEAAHELQIVHRDLKLENVMVVGGKHVKVLDFGLARSLLDPSTAMTATGLVSGTPQYMAPEVGFDGAPPAPSQDMYSLGVMLAEMALGRPLWNGPTIEALFTKKLETEAAIADVPSPLKSLVRSLLSSDPGRRPTATQARQLLRDLEGRPAIALELDDHAPSLGLQPTADIKVEVSTTPDPFAALDTVGTMGLDELPQPPSEEVKHAATIAEAPATPAVDDDPRFAFPNDQELRADQLTIDPADLQKSARLSARRPPPAVVKKSKVPAVLLTLVLLGGLGGGGAYYWFVHRNKATPQRLEGPGISITIEADGAREIMVDGKPAGKTPVKLQVPQGKKPILITGPGLADREVVPDRDQTIELEVLR